MTVLSTVKSTPLRASILTSPILYIFFTSLNSIYLLTIFPHIFNYLLIYYITTKTYYYRLRKVREAICQNVRENAPEIAEIPLTAKEQSFTGIRITTVNGTMDVNNASMETMERLLRVMLHAE